MLPWTRVALGLAGGFGEPGHRRRARGHTVFPPTRPCICVLAPGGSTSVWTPAPVHRRSDGWGMGRHVLP